MSKRAWLLTWEGTDPRITEQTKLVAVVSFRRSSSFVFDLAEMLYRRNYETATEMNNYSAKGRTYLSSRAPITIGHNPFIYARLVTELRIMIDEPRLNEYLTWKEPVKIIQRPEKNYALEIIQPAKYQELVRPYLPLANELKTRSP